MEREFYVYLEGLSIPDVIKQWYMDHVHQFPTKEEMKPSGAGNFGFETRRLTFARSLLHVIVQTYAAQTTRCLHISRLMRLSGGRSTA